MIVILPDAIKVYDVLVTAYTMYIVFDIGGTHLRVGISSDGQTLQRYEIADTPDTYSQSLQLLREISTRLNPESLPIISAAGGVPGPLNPQRTQLVAAPHLTDWLNHDLASDLRAIWNCDVWLENDTALVGLGEATAGAGRGESIVAYVTVSTGVGGARIVDGELDENVYGFEPGHQLIELTQENSSPQLIQLEQLVSGTGIREKYHKQPSELSDMELAEVMQHLAVGLHNLTLFWSPNVIVLGGGLVNAGIIDLVKLNEYSLQIPSIFPQSPRLLKASLENIGGLHGGLALIKQKRN